MKITFFHGIVIGLALVVFSAMAPSRLHAQDANAAAQLPPPILDHDEMMQLIKARETVFAAHPDLKAENEKLRQLHNATTAPTAEQRNATFVEWKGYQKKMRVEMLKIDPTLKPIFAKVDAAAQKGGAPFQPAPAK